MSEILQEIVSLLTSGLTQIASGIGSGLQEMVTSIFLNTEKTGLSVFGGVVIVFAGVSLAIGLCRWVTNFITSLGN